MFDLILYPFHFTASREQADFPGLQAVTPPRRAERHRSGDLLVALLSGPGGLPLPEALVSESLQVLSSAFYASGGTLTSALRDGIEALNESLLNHKLKSNGSGQAILLNLAALHNDQVYLVHAGPVHTFALSKEEAHEYFDPSGTGRGLGTSQTVNIRFFQPELQPGDLLLFTVEPPAAWTAANLTGSTRLSPEALRYRLLNQAPPEIRAGVVQLKEGSGKVSRASLGRASEPLPAAAPSRGTPAPASPPVNPPAPAAARPASPRSATAGSAVSSRPVPPAPLSQPGLRPDPAGLPALEPLSSGEILSEDAVVSAARRRIEERKARAAYAQAAAPKPAGSKSLFARLFARKPVSAAAEIALERPVIAPTAPPLKSKPATRPWLRGLAAFFRSIQTAQQRTGRGLARVIPRVLPSEKEQPASLSPLTMFFIAVAVPVMVVAVATTVYLRSGAGEQRLAYMAQARTYAEQAGKAKENALRRSAWTQTIYWINKAEEFGGDDESRALMYKAQVALDSMDGIVRLDLTPAFTGILSSDVNITRIAANTTELYLLDSSKGRVLHLTLAGRSYEYDPNFICGPGPSSGKIISELIGMAILPPNNDLGASVIALDRTGNVVYCVPGETPLSNTLQRPDNNWGKIAAMSFYNGNLYVLDTQNSAVWRYDGDNLSYSGKPRLFFGNEVPNLNNVVDMAIYQDDLYLLRSNGRMTICTYSGFDFSPTRCNDPINYGARSGLVKTFTDANFLQMQTTQPPDPSLFILDSKGPSIYHFSLRLNYQRQLRQNTSTDFPLPNRPITSFYITPSRVIFMAFGSQIYFGAMP